MHPLAMLARDAVEHYVRRGEVLVPDETMFPPELRQPAGVFVCIKKHGRLRGCIGTFEPCESSIIKETVRNAVRAALRDPRFSPIQPGELLSLVYSVDVLAPPLPVSDKTGLDPVRFGVIVQAGARRGLLLPALAGVDTVEQQITIACEKAGIGPDEDFELSGFTVERYC